MFFKSLIVMLFLAVSSPAWAFKVSIPQTPHGCSLVRKVYRGATKVNDRINFVGRFLLKYPNEQRKVNAKIAIEHIPQLRFGFVYVSLQVIGCMNPGMRITITKYPMIKIDPTKPASVFYEPIHGGHLLIETKELPITTPEISVAIAKLGFSKLLWQRIKK